MGRETINGEFQKKRGRPRRIIIDQGEIPMRIDTAISKKIYDLVPKDVHWKDLIEHAVLAMYGNKEEADLRVLQEQLEKAELEASKIRLAISEKKAELERLQSMERAMRIQQKIPAVALRLLILDMKRLTPYEKMLSDPDGIARRYGISLDFEKFNRDFSGYVADILAGEEERVAREVGVKIVDSDPILVDKIRALAEKEVG